MNWRKSDSLERFLSTRLWLFSLPAFLGAAVLLHKLSMPLWGTVLSELAVLFFYLWLNANIKRKVFAAYDRSMLHIEAIHQEDYHQYARAAFTAGAVQDFHQQLYRLGEHLQVQKSRYDQHAFLVYQLITQLDSPILVFNEKQKLTFGNDEFHNLFGQPWQIFRYGSPELLGLEKNQQTWQFAASEKNQKWQIRHSRFIDDGQSHELLIFIDVEPVLRTSQLNAWQQIIRVLGHEIRNILAPVSSMAESLSTRATEEQDKAALNIITERCQHLQDFVTRYATLTEPLVVHTEWLVVSHLTETITGLFEELPVVASSSVERIWADETLLTQVLINLVRNAREANASSVDIKISETDRHHVIEIRDDGHGLSNLENLFVPLYSTKLHGQGIGLTFCRNIVEKHGGTIALRNNSVRGATVTIKLPRP